MKRSLLLLLITFFIGCSSNYPPLATVKQVDLNAYLGTWYEIARYEHYFQKGCSDVNATYSLKENGDIKVVNQCIKDGKLSRAIGVAYPVDTTNAKLKVSFFRPFYGNYWILMLGDDYEYALIGEPSREYLWILSREKKLKESIKQMILKKLPSLGYTLDKLLWTTFKQR